MEEGGDKKVFDRVEKKCLITEEQKKKLVKILKKYMVRDDYHKAEVFNIYFDTDNDDLIQQSIDQPVFKEKFRARSYGGYDKVFLEIKTKLRGKEKNIGHKRRVLLTRREYEKVLKGKATVLEIVLETQDERGEREFRNDCQIAKEMDYLLQHFELKPKILVTYFRESYTNGEGLRVTFDEKLRYRTEGLKFRKSRSDKKYFEDGDERNVLMEVKAEGAWPMWLARLLSEERIFANRFSKVGKIYEKIRKEEIKAAKAERGAKGKGESRAKRRTKDGARDGVESRVKSGAGDEAKIVTRNRAKDGVEKKQKV